ncbi:MAG TPA: hypothetical protein VF718_10560 [Allosphingosinicella sp.]|jgi:hypothetical protein
MRFALVALVLALPAASSAEAPSARPAAKAAASARICADDMRVRDAQSPEAARPKRLGELPSGSLTLTVLNKAGDCIEPVTVRHGYGAMERRR